MNHTRKKFVLLMWKNFTLQKRHKVQTVVEILIPLLFTLILISIRTVINPRKFGSKTEYDAFNPMDPSETRVPFGNYILYAPDDARVNTLMQNVAKKFQDELDKLPPRPMPPPPPGESVPLVPGKYTFIACKNEKDMLKTYNETSSSTSFSPLVNANPVLGGVLIDGLDSDNIKYTLRFPANLHNPTTKNDLGLKPRWATEFLYEIFPLPRDRDHPEGENDINKLSKERGGSPGYWTEGFLFLQAILETEIIKMKAPNPSDVDKYTVLLKRFPYPPYTNDKFVVALLLQLPIFVMLSYLYSFVNIAKNIGYEKERRLKESMKIMGLDNWLHWSAWFTKSFIFLMLSTSLMIALYKIPWFEGHTLAILTYSDTSLLCFFFLAYLFATITLAFFISTCSSSAGSASTIAGVVFFLSYFPYFFLHPRYHQLSFFLKIFMSLFSNTAMAFGCRLISTFEGTAAGIQWKTFNVPTGPDDDITIFHIFMMLIVDGVLYLFAAIYIEAVFPGDYGVPLPWYFPFTKWYWMDTPRVAPVREFAEVSDIISSDQHADAFEKEPEGYAGIQIKGLTKVFKKKVAVKNLCLNFYENQVTALLGHNGAGKTTTMSMLTGMFPPTSGTATVNGFDIRNDMKAARNSLGLCPQHDVLFDELTVEEHLQFFCLLKGVPKHFVDAEIDRMLGVISLDKKRHAQSHTLSGGMKRKLSVGIALIGGSKIVLLDEPTSGMDPGARRSTWDLITNEKKGRTILLSTHFMDEADLLGDRIVIMADGEARCCGSSLFLKKKYGGGYRLIIVKAANCNVDEITGLLKKRIPEVQVYQNIGAELSYSLPDEKSSLFSEMFEELEKRKKELGIDSYGCSITEMEEVFMRVGEQVERDSREVVPKESSIMPQETNPASLSKISVHPSVNEQKSKEGKDTETISKSDVSLKESTLYASLKERDATSVTPSHVEQRRNKGFHLLKQQLRAMLTKKWLYFSRNKALVVFQMFIPVLYLIITLIMLKTLPKLEKPTARTMGLWDYNRLKGASIYTLCKCSGDSICNTYQEFVSIHSRISCSNQPKSLDSFILEEYKKSISEVNFKYIVGFDRSVVNGKETLTGYFNGQPFHTPPLALNLISNAIFREVTKNSMLNLTVTNYPFEYLSKDKVEHLIETGNEGYTIGFNVSFGMSFLAASFLIFIIKERETKSKHLQFVTGVKFPIFWLAHYIVDVLYYLIPTLLLMITLIIFNQKDFGCKKDDDGGEHNKGCKQGLRMQGYLFVVLFCYGVSVIPLMYIFSFFFTVPSSGYTKTAYFNFLTGMATILTASILQLKSIGLDELADKLEWFFMVFPNFDLGYSIGLLASNLKLHKECDPALEAIRQTLKAVNVHMHPCEFISNFTCCTLGWHSPGILRHLVYLILIGTFSVVILFMIEAKIFQHVRYLIEIKRFSKSPAVEPTQEINEDDDVATENARIRCTDLPVLLQTENMILHDLTKFYGGFLAVRKLCLGVKHGECFGLLGQNGAGKTTTFKMVTGDIPITAGNAYIASRSVRTQLKEAQKLLGYCPQYVDTLLPELTGRETISLFARLRGIPEEDIPSLITFLGESLIFSEHMNKPCGTYSGGNKRKLSTALALIGNPPLVCLDEPTSGMDPVARRHLWNAVISVQNSGTSVVLTSHSMEECEALCTRLAIMVNGSFRCLGSSQHLKSKFGAGYTVIAQLEIKMDMGAKEDDRAIVEMGTRRDSIEEKRVRWNKDLLPFRTFIEENFPDCELRESHPGYVHYHIQEQEGLTWGKIFKKMEEAKALFKLEAYSVGQTTLEQVFLRFTKEQT